MKEKTIREFIENADDKKLAYAWNHMCCETDRYDDAIHDNEEYALDEMFCGSVDSALRAACYGDYHYSDTWFVLNGYGNMDSFSYLSDENCPIDTDELVEFFMENPEDFGMCFDCDIEDLEEDEDDDVEIICPRCGERLGHDDYEYDIESGHMVVTTCPNCFCSDLQVEIRGLDDKDDESDEDNDEKED